MADGKIQMPQSGGGLVRYSEGVKSKVELSPYAVLGMILVVILIEIVLHMLG